MGKEERTMQPNWNGHSEFDPVMVGCSSRAKKRIPLVHSGQRSHRELNSYRAQTTTPSMEGGRRPWEITFGFEWLDSNWTRLFVKVCLNSRRNSLLCDSGRISRSFFGKKKTAPNVWFANSALRLWREVQCVITIGIA